MGVIAMMYQKGEFLQERRDSFVVTFDLDSVLGFDKAKVQHLRFGPWQHSCA